MVNGRRFKWTDLHVWAFQTPCLRGLEGAERIAALYRWKTGQAQHLVWFYRNAEELRSPDRVDWARFPERGAAEAAVVFPPLRSPLFAP